MRKNTKGSTLVAAIAVIMIIMIVLGASLTIASSYYKRSINENTKKQVYLSAKSYAEVVAVHIKENNYKLIPENEGDQIDIKDIQIDDEAIDVSGYILRIDKDTLKIVIKTQFDHYHYELQLVMKMKDLQWYTNSYCEAKAGDVLC